MNFQVGKLEYFEKRDPVFAEYMEAIEFATSESFDDSVYGVWTSQEENSDLVAIVYQQEVFEK